MTITVKPRQLITASSAEEVARLKTYLDGIGYTIGGQYATRTDDDGVLTVTIEYPEWTLTV